MVHPLVILKHAVNLAIDFPRYQPLIVQIGDVWLSFCSLLRHIRAVIEDNPLFPHKILLVLLVWPERLLLDIDRVDAVYTHRMMVGGATISLLGVTRIGPVSLVMVLKHLEELIIKLFPGSVVLRKFGYVVDPVNDLLLRA